MTEAAKTENAGDKNLARENAKTPDRGRESGHTPKDATATHEPAGDKDHSATEKARPKDTDRGGA